MSAFSDYLENEILNHVLRGEVYTPPDNVYVSLHTAPVGDDGSGAEVAGASYERKLVSFTEATDSEAENTAALIWVNMPATTVVAIGVWDNDDDPDPGNLLFHGNLIESRPLSAGDPFTFNIGDLRIVLD